LGKKSGPYLNKTLFCDEGSCELTMHKVTRPRSALRVGIATSGRFHLLDLAREFDALGINVRFYSYVPRKRARKFGLPSRCHVALLPFLFPLVAIQRLFPRLFPRVVERMMCWALDTLVILKMRSCDAFICMSGTYLLAPRFAKWRYGAKVLVHRGSQHILAQDQILSQLPQARRPAQFIIRREIAGYALADLILIPSEHVAKSFQAWPSLTSKLLQNTYGVNLSQFPLRNGSSPTHPTVLYVGTWSYQKGSDVLARAIFTMESVRLVHVGDITDAPFPEDIRFIHYEPVPQWQLTAFYQRAHVFTLPSRQDGFGVVLSQALASGLPVVCTDRTGGPDLARLSSIVRLIRVVPVEDVNSLRRALAEALDDATGKTGVPPITEAEREVLSWRYYADRYLRTLEQML
jgi:glycosyltransferase involved in cell wall biosynthesis